LGAAEPRRANGAVYARIVIRVVADFIFERACIFSPIPLDDAYNLAV
jgi:hypothetical protein